AFDTASLLVALLRAANVPARYAFGTVRMPAASVMNWVGNVQVPEAAGNLLGQGGVPSKMLVSGGRWRTSNWSMSGLKPGSIIYPAVGQSTASVTAGFRWMPATSNMNIKTVWTLIRLHFLTSNPLQTQSSSKQPSTKLRAGHRVFHSRI